MFCHSERKRRIFPFRADSHFLYPSLRSPARGCGNPFLSHFPSPANLRICRFFYCAFYHFRNSAFFPCEKKAPKKHTKAGREKSPRLAIHPSARRRLLLSIIRRRACRRSAALLMKCFELETWVLSPMRCDNPIL